MPFDNLFDQKQAFYLREENGFCVKEIADIQGISAEAVKSRMRYAYRQATHSYFGNRFSRH